MPEQGFTFRDSGVTPVFEVVHHLHVEETQISDLGHEKQVLFGGKSAGVHNGVEPPESANFEHRAKKPGLAQRFTTRESHPATGVVVEDPVFQNDLDDLFDAHCPASHLSRLGWTGVGTGSTEKAALGIPRAWRPEGNGEASRTRRDALAATDATAGCHQDLGTR